MIFAERFLKCRSLRCFKKFSKSMKAVNQRGMTLIEIIIVITLLVSLMAYLATNLMSTSESAKEDQSKLAMGAIQQSLQIYRVHNNRYPTTEQGLSALLTAPGDAKNWRGPYIEANKLRDPWGNDFAYESDGRTIKMVSAGSDGQMGTGDDVTYPDEGKDQKTP